MNVKIYGTTCNFETIVHLFFKWSIQIYLQQILFACNFNTDRREIQSPYMVVCRGNYYDGDGKFMVIFFTVARIWTGRNALPFS